MDYGDRVKLMKSFRVVAQGNLLQTMHASTGGHQGLCRGLEKSMREGRSDQDSLSIAFGMMTPEGMDTVKDYVNKQLKEMVV